MLILNAVQVPLLWQKVRFFARKQQNQKRSYAESLMKKDWGIDYFQSKYFLFVWDFCFVDLVLVIVSNCTLASFASLCVFFRTYDSPQLSLALANTFIFMTLLSYCYSLDPFTQDCHVGFSLFTSLASEWVFSVLNSPCLFPYVSKKNFNRLFLIISTL